jgi:hypothetical protein
VIEKRKRVDDDQVLDNFRGKPCCVCGRPSDPAHVKSRGSGGDDVEWNVVRLCREHHTEQHKIGWRKICDKHPALAIDLFVKGWTFDEHGKLRRK